MAEVEYELLDLDPATLIIGTNVRTETHADAKEFARSIRERGVLEVITGYRDDDGNIVVERGQRRTVVAARVGTPSGTVPVRVGPRPEEADRIVDQVSENIHREAMRESEVLNAVEQLALIGVSAAQIAKRTQIKRANVDAALTVSQSEEARDRVGSGDLTLEQAAIFAEFEGDEEATATLEREVKRGRSLAHTAQRLRDAADERAAIAVEVERLRAEGLPAIHVDDAPSPRWQFTLTEMRDSEGNPVAEDEFAHVPGAAVYVTAEWEYPEDDEDEGDSVEPARVFATTWIVTDPAAAGLAHMSAGDSTSTGEPSDADREAQRAERQRVIARNKAWRSATAVRREWLAGFCARRTAPKGAEALICEAVLGCDHHLGRGLQHGHRGLLALTGDVDAGLYGTAEAREKLIKTATTPKAQAMRVLAAIVAAWDHDTDVHTWRNPNTWDERIMGALVEWGYSAAPVERILLGADPGDDALTEDAEAA